MTAPEPDFDALARAVRTRRGVLRLPQDLQPLGGPSEMTVSRLERGQSHNLRSGTKTQLERALGWQAGTIDRILDGTSTAEEIEQTVYGPVVETTDPATPVRRDLASAVADLTSRLVDEGNRTPTMAEAVEVLSRLLPELYAEEG